MAEEFPDLVSMWERITTRYAERPLFAEKGSSGWVWHSYAEVAERSTRNGSNGSNPQPMVARDYLEILDSLG